MTLPEPFEIRSEPLRDGGLRLALRGELDAATADLLLARMAAIEAGCERLVLDLRHLVFMGSAGIGAIVRAHHQLQARQVPLTVLVAPGGAIERVVALTALSEIVDVDVTG